MDPTVKKASQRATKIMHRIIRLAKDGKSIFEISQLTGVLEEKIHQIIEYWQNKSAIKPTVGDPVKQVLTQEQINSIKELYIMKRTYAEISSLLGVEQAVIVECCKLFADTQTLNDPNVNPVHNAHGEETKLPPLTQKDLDAIKKLADNNIPADTIIEVLSLNPRLVKDALGMIRRPNAKLITDLDFQVGLEETKRPQLTQQQINSIKNLAAQNLEAEAVAEILGLDLPSVNEILFLLKKPQIAPLPNSNLQPALLAVNELNFDAMSFSEIAEEAELNIALLKSIDETPLVTQTLQLLLQLILRNRTHSEDLRNEADTLQIVRDSTARDEEVKDLRDSINYLEVKAERIYSYSESTSTLWWRDLNSNQTSSKVIKNFTFLAGSYWVEVPDKSLIITGGVDHKTTKQAWKIDTNSFEVAQLEPMLQRRRSHGSCYHAGYVYALSGLESDSFRVRNCERLSLVTNRWERIPDEINCPVADICPIVVENSIYIVGGFETTPCKKVQVLILHSLKWKSFNLSISDFSHTISSFVVPDRNGLFFISDNKVIHLDLLSHEITLKKKLLKPGQSKGGQCYYYNQFLHLAFDAGEPRFEFLGKIN